jgi:hypothetical protein
LGEGLRRFLAGAGISPISFFSLFWAYFILFAYGSGVFFLRAAFPIQDTSMTCLSLLIRFRGQNRRGINKLTTLALAVETTPQRVDDIGLSGPPPDLRG